MSAIDTPTAWDLRRRLGITAPLREQAGDAPGALVQQIRARRAEKEAVPTDTPAWRAADLAEQALVAALARGGLTPDGIEWLIGRVHPGPETSAGTPRRPTPPVAPQTDHIPALPARSSGRAGGSGTARHRGVRAAGT